MPKASVAGAVVGSADGRIFGLSSTARLDRQLARAGVADDAAAAERIALLRADWVYDESLVKGLVGADAATALQSDAGPIVAVVVARADRAAAEALLREGRAPDGARIVSPRQLAGDYNDALRKREPPLLVPLTGTAIDAIERRVFAGSYKGVTDLVTLYLWPAPALQVTRWCAAAGITPNQVTAASLVLVLVAMALFWTGQYAAGLVAAWAMTFLDTVDGKLARVTLQSSRFGNVFDHGIDLVHPPFWWWAWIVGLPAAGFALDGAPLVLAAIVGGYVLQRVEEGVFIAAFGIEMHVWQRFDSRFRLVTARRNPNLVLLTGSLLVGRPDWGIVAVAVWTVVCLAVHLLRLVQAFAAKRRGRLRSWLAATA